MILVRAYIDRNFGDDCMLWSVARKYPDILFVVYANPEWKDSAPFSGIDNIIFSRMGFEPETLAIFDGFLMLGGSLFQEKKANFIIYLREIVSVTRYMRDHDKFSLICGCNIGPIRSRMAEKELQRLGEYTDRMIVRDTYSVGFLDAIGISSPVTQSIDYVLSMRKELEKYRLHTEGTVLGFSVVASGEEKKDELIVDLFSKLISRARAAKMNEKMILFCLDSGKENDERIADRIIAIAGKEGVEKVVYNGDIGAFIGQLSRASYMVTARFHSMVISVAFGIPFLPFVYCDKTGNFLDDIEYRGHRLDYSSGVANEIMDDVVAKRCDYNHEKVDRLVEGASAYTDLFTEYFGEKEDLYVQMNMLFQMMCRENSRLNAQLNKNPMTRLMKKLRQVLFGFQWKLSSSYWPSIKASRIFSDSRIISG